MNSRVPHSRVPHAVPTVDSEDGSDGPDSPEDVDDMPVRASQGPRAAATKVQHPAICLGSMVAWFSPLANFAFWCFYNDIDWWTRCLKLVASSLRTVSAPYLACQLFAKCLRLLHFNSFGVLLDTCKS